MFINNLINCRDSFGVVRRNQHQTFNVYSTMADVSFRDQTETSVSFAATRNA